MGDLRFVQDTWGWSTKWTQILREPETVECGNIIGEVHGRVCSIVIRVRDCKHHVGREDVCILVEDVD